MNKRRRASSGASRGADGDGSARKKKKLDPSEMCQQLYDTIRSFKKEDGNLLCDSFIRAPKRRQEPQYYEVVSQPIDLKRVQQKLKMDTYEDLDELSADIELLVNNAKAFYKPDTPEYKDANELWKLYKYTKHALENGEEVKPPRVSRTGSLSRRSDVAEDLSETSTNNEEDNIFEELFSAEDERFSNVVVRRRKQSGYIVRSRKPLPWNSPSTTSTTSLAQLHDKLAALPPIYYTKEPIKICAQPELPVLREVSECEDKSVSLSNVSRSKPFGVCQSDSEVKTYSRKRNISPDVPKTDKPVSLMLMTTLGSADESIISNTIEKINKSIAEFDLLDLLVKETFQNGPEKDSGIITDKKTQDSEVIENTQFEKQAQSKITSQSRKVHNIVVNSTSDESNTEFASMFVDNQKCMNTMLEAMHEIDKRTQSEIIAGITDIMADKLAERDQRIREMMEDFNKGQKERAREVLRADVKQKNVMLTLLREDLQAHLDFISTQIM